MKKYLIVGVIISSFLLGSCSVDWKDEKDKKISELEKQVQELKKNNENDLFKKKQECAKNREDMTKQALDIGHIQGVTSINEIFYSKTNATCYYTAYGANSYLIFDYFNNKYFDGANYDNPTDTRRLYKIINDLKKNN